ncbi:B3 domain-containing protein REM10-like [Rutidosis leptorrhynchoides]|uniref:B3 domain-containing protein REM10-like n=1 Tax=Rutidosis leptorrhynchoides TaxID=125765 RepID=UPI003A998529
MASTPEFYQILLIPSSENLLQLPPSFVTKYLGNNIPTNPIVRSANGGYVWQLKIDKIDDEHFFTNGWPDVVRDAELRFGHFVLFRLVDENTFKMFVYNPDGCEKILKPNALVYDHVMKDDHRLPTEFVKLAKIEDKQTIILKNSVGIEWEMGIRPDYSNVTTRYHLSTSWCDFRRANNLSIGDQCVFKFLKSENKMCLADVTKKHGRVKMTSRCDKCGVERNDEPVVRRGRPPKRMHLPRQQ